MNMLSKAIITAAFAMTASVGMITSAKASVVVQGTRIIFKGGQREVTVKLNNAGKAPSLVQVWLDDGNQSESPDAIKVPFTITPPVARLDPGKGQALRVLYTGEPLPTDRESIFWFNMLDIPPKADSSAKNYLQIAFRTRIKLFYRPKGLSGSLQDAMKGLRWSVEPNGSGYALKAINSSPYHVSFSKLSLNVGGHTYEAGGGMVNPLSDGHFVLNGLTSKPPADATVELNAINDFGGSEAIKQPLSP